LESVSKSRDHFTGGWHVFFDTLHLGRPACLSLKPGGQKMKRGILHHTKDPVIESGYRNAEGGRKETLNDPHPARHRNHAGTPPRLNGDSRPPGLAAKFAFVAMVGILAAALHVSAALAMEPHFSFDDIVQRADAVFLGKVVNMECRNGPNGKMIFTDVSFEVEELIYSRDEFLSKMVPVMVLSFAGGELDGKAVSVSDVPSFALDAHYILFTLMDGESYASPLVGSYQGLFDVIVDEITGAFYPLAPGRRPILQVRNGRVIGGPPVARIRSGIPEKANEQAFAVRVNPTLPTSVTGGGTAELAIPVQVAAEAGQAMDLDAFIAEIHRRVR
jgi:hypothetical protein